MQHPDEGKIHAWLDGALSDEESKAIESHVAECEECASAVAEARGLIAASSRIVSALDVVPGGVIPAAKPQRAAWYTNTQLRAAAAVIIVAGASLLVMRNGRQEAVMQQARPMIAAAPAPATAAATPPSAGAEKPTEVDKAAAQSAPSIALKAKKVASTAEARARRENSQRESAADQIVPAAPPPSPAAATETRAGAARTAEPQRALFGKVSGVAMITAGAPELLQVRADTTAVDHRTIYQVSPGVEVTLVESSPPLSAGASVSAKAAERRVAQRTAAPPVANAPRDVVINSISWVSKLGRVMTLSGPVSKEELQALRLRLPAEKQ